MKSFNEVLKETKRRLGSANIHSGHGYDSIHDEAVALVLYAANMPLVQNNHLENEPFPTEHLNRLNRFLDDRCVEKIPTAYIIGTALLAGIQFICDERALIPRSPIAQALIDRLLPWRKADTSPEMIVDVCCGGGSLGILASHVYPDATVVLSDLDWRALSLASENVRLTGLEPQVICVQGDLLEAIACNSVDLILANPPYVSIDEILTLPAEYQHEPRFALEAARNGTALARHILYQAEKTLSHDGLLIIELGETWIQLEREFPKVPFVWMDLPNGGAGVAVINAKELRDWRANGIL